MGLAVLCLFGVSLGRVGADEVLTLELPPSQAALEARAAEARTKAQSVASQGTRRSSGRGMRNLAARGQASSERMIVGMLGQLTVRTPIYRKPDGRSRLLVTAVEGTYLALREEAGGWYGVLMADGSLGWLPKQNVHSLNAPAALDRPFVPSGSDEGDIYPRQETIFFTGNAQALFQEASKYLGVRYVWGGNTANGIDCSGFVKNVFGACGFGLPRLGSDQMAYGVAVPNDQLQPGDRLYFGRRRDRVGITHTGIYLGEGAFIHASSSRHGVAVSRLDEPLYHRIFVCARR